ncbi:hypothetical protein MKW92_012170 [Papaver armeniacum]|nr:hypothetical protein MKW92_012170 [Papaver armeniacum]
MRSDTDKACLKDIHPNLLRIHLLCLRNPLKSENILEDECDNLEPQVEEDIMHAVKDDGKLIMKEEEVNKEEEEAGPFSPELQHDDEIEEAIDPDEDKNELERKRQALHKNNWELKASKVMGDAIFGSGAEVNLDAQVYYWWNKYNQTHYDHDNPPPKIVQGYKFNIAMVRHALYGSMQDPHTRT